MNIIKIKKPINFPIIYDPKVSLSIKINAFYDIEKVDLWWGPRGF